MNSRLPELDRDLAAELEETKARLAEAMEMLDAIRSGEVDALVVARPDGERVFSLQGAETPYRCLIEQMHEGALLLMPEGTILYANAQFAGMASRPLEQLIGSAWEELFAPAELPRLRKLLLSARSAKTREEFRMQTASGVWCPVEISLLPLPLDPAGILAGIVTDLSERKAAEAQLLSTNEHLREMVAELEHVSYAIVHDMRAPLRAMEGFGMLLGEQFGPLSPAQRKEFSGRIASAAVRLDRLIQDTLAYNKAILQPIPMEPVKVSNLLHEIIQTYPNLQPDKADIRIQGRIPPVLGNETLLTQCFSNLLGNAVKFVAPGTRPQLHVWAKSTASNFVRICIDDNGVGIPKQALHRLFGMFQRLHSGYEGTGIGLAIVRKVVSRMGGRVGAEARQEGGSRFWIELRPASDSQGGSPPCQGPMK